MKTPIQKKFPKCISCFIALDKLVNTDQKERKAKYQDECIAGLSADIDFHSRIDQKRQFEIDYLGPKQ